jgi:hypothetical protein
MATYINIEALSRVVRTDHKPRTMKNLIFAAIILASTTTFAQDTDTLDVRNNKLLLNNIKTGTREYLVYGVNARGKTGNLWLWKRTVERSKFQGKDVLVFNQKWFASDTANVREVYSIASAKDLQPVYHYTKFGTRTDAFEFGDGKISGADSVAGNNQKDLEVAAPVLPYNWELDLETFQAFPFKTGKQFAVNFYHPGGRTGPAYYLYKVTGEETIPGSNNQSIECWTLKIDYAENSWAIFWISKKSKEVIKMQELYNGNYRYKVLLTTNP